MDLSIVIPTHNRGNLLKGVLENILTVLNNSSCSTEIVVVDNNSSDSTRNIIAGYKRNFTQLRYVFEAATSFSKARNTGGNMAKGKFLLFLDDDVNVKKGSFDEIVSIFNKYKGCGVVAGRILPKFLEKPPRWVSSAQKIFNGLSLYDKKYLPTLNKDFQEVLSANGPMLAVRKDTFRLIGGFPPDTIGVETDIGGKEFRKLFIGPGDYGLCIKARKIGYKIYYSKRVSCFHLIPQSRLTVSFWRARLISEGQYEAISSRYFFKRSRFTSYFQVLVRKVLYARYKEILSNKLRPTGRNTHNWPIYPEELLLHYYRSFIEMSELLNNNKTFGKYLWEIGEKGVSTKEYEKVFKRLPGGYKMITDSNYIYNNRPAKSIKDYETTFERLGNRLYNLGLFRIFSAPILIFLDVYMKARKNIFLQRIYLTLSSFLYSFQPAYK